LGHPVHEIEVTEERERREWKAPPRQGSTWKAPASSPANDNSADNSARLLPPPAKRK